MALSFLRFSYFPSPVFSCSSTSQAGSRVSLSTPSLSPLTLVSTGFSLLAKTLSTVPYPLGPTALRHFWNLAQLRKALWEKARAQ